MRKSPAQITSAPIQSATVKDFSGGWNTSESELNIDSKYSIIEDNMYYGTDGTLKARQGTELFGELESIATANFVDGYFFFAYIISVAEDGSVYATDGTGSSARIWPKVGSAPWSPTAAVSFVEMNGDLHIHNGVNKPIRITTVLNTNYLVDAGTGINLNVPIGLVAAKHGDWHCIAVGSVLHVSHTRSPGTFAGDPPPNIAASVDLGSRVTRGNKTITAMISYRDTLLVMFEQCIVPVAIAVNTGGTALEITIDDAIDNYGAFNHRVVQNLGDDVLFCDTVGVQSVARTVFSKTVTPEYESQVISIDVQKAIKKLSTINLRQKVFSVFDTSEKCYMMFVPIDDQLASAYERTCFIKVDQTKPRRIETWARFRGWNWSYACRSAEGNIFFGLGKQIYLWGRAGVDNIFVDFKGDQETFTDGTTFDDHTGFTPVADFENSGLPIKVVREFPWSFMKRRENIKKCKYIAVDTEGTAPFTVSMFVDYLYEDQDSVGDLFTDLTAFDDGTGFDQLDNPDLKPQLSMEFMSREAPQFGAQLFGNSPYGGGRTTAEARLYKWPSKFKLMKLRVDGEITEEFKFIAVTLSYQIGSIRRGG